MAASTRCSVGRRDVAISRLRCRKRVLMRQRLLLISLSGCVYAFAGYPVLLWVASRVLKRPVHKADVTPSLSIIIPAHNEEAIIQEKVESILVQDYPMDMVEVLVASDGSTDRTNDTVAAMVHHNVRLLDYPRGGKAATLNRAVSEARNDILVFTDANAILAPGALQALVRSFADPSVGGVSANERRVGSDGVSGAGLGERLYWEYDKWVKRSESSIGSIVSASGSMYAVRRELFQPITDPAATDDFAISTQVIRAKRRLVFEPEAVTWEPTIADRDIEFGRRVRIVTRGMRSVMGVRELLLPWNSGFYALQLWSHKVIRRGLGIMAAFTFVLSLSLVHRPIYAALTVAQAFVYGLAVLGWVGEGKRWGRKPWFYVPYYFCLSNVAATLGLIAFVRQRKVTVWEPRRDVESSTG